MEEVRCPHGALTLVPMPGFDGLAQEVKRLIEGREKGQKTSVDVAMPLCGTRASGEPFVQLGKDHIAGHDCVVLMSGPGTFKTLTELQLVLGYLVGRRARRIAVVAAYMPLTRSDKDEGMLELTLMRHVVHLIESSAYGQLDRVIAVDLHSAQEVGFGSRPGLITEVSLMQRLLVKVLEDARAGHPGMSLCLLMPDEGALKRYEAAVVKAREKFGLASNVALVCCEKRRKDSESSRLVGMNGDVDAMAGALVVAIDDEIATGGTNIHTAEFARQKYGAAKYWAVVVHGVLCGDAPRKFANQSVIDRVYITDTIPTHNRPELSPLMSSGLLRVVPWAADLAQIIYFHHWDHSIREMR